MRFILCFIALFLIYTPSLSGQTTKKEDPQYRYAFKGYLGFSDQKQSNKETFGIGNFVTTTQHNKAFLPIIAFAKYRKNGQFWELSVTNFNFSHEDTQTLVEINFSRDSVGNLVSIPIFKESGRGLNVLTNHLGLRFEWNIPIFLKKNNIFQPFLGISYDPSVFYQKKIPFLTSAFPTRVFELSNTFTIVPRLTYMCSKRFFVDVNVPISIITLSAQYKFEENPILPRYARETFNLTSRAPNNMWAIRLGIGYRI